MEGLGWGGFGRGRGEVGRWGGITARMKISMGLLDGLRPRNREVVLDQEEVSSVVVLHWTRGGGGFQRSAKCVSPRAPPPPWGGGGQEIAGRKGTGTVLRKRH